MPARPTQDPASGDSRRGLILLAAIAVVCVAQSHAGNLGNVFSYQGKLNLNGTAVNGSCDFQFSLYDAAGSGTPPTGGTILGAAQTLLNVNVVQGLFTVTLNGGGEFGANAFVGQERWLQIAVRHPAGSGAYTTLAPRQKLDPSPFALALRPGAKIAASISGAVMTVANSLASGAGNAAILAQTASGAAVRGESADDNGFGVAGFKSGYSASDYTDQSYYRPGGLFGGKTGAAGVTKQIDGAGLFGWYRGGTTNPPAGAGVLGISSSSTAYAGMFRSSTGHGVYIESAYGKNGILMYGNSYIYGNSTVTGVKSAAVEAGDETRLLYCEESTEVWFSDYGFGQLRKGAAEIALDPVFARTVDLSQPYHVFLQPYGDANLYVENRSPQGFAVRLRDGDPAAEFSYRVVAKRSGFAGKRLERAPAAEKPAPPMEMAIDPAIGDPPQAAE